MAGVGWGGGGGGGGLAIGGGVGWGGGVDRSGGRDRLKQRHKWQGDGHKPFVTHTHTHSLQHCSISDSTANLSRYEQSG